MYDTAVPDIDWSRFAFHPVILLPDDYEVYDFTAGYDPHRTLRTPYGIGKYDERRVGMYSSELFAGGRDVHMGIDLGAPVGTPVHAFYDGEVHLTGYNPAPGDYGHTVITRHRLDGHWLYALHGHLDARSSTHRRPGERFRAGDVIAWVGDRHENGGWNPHLHFQLSWYAPEVPDLPGAVRQEDRARAVRIFPDPRYVLGPIY